MKLPAWLPLALAAALAVSLWYGLGQRAALKVAKAEAGAALLLQAEAHELDKAKIQRAHAFAIRELRTRENLSQRRLGEALKAAGVRSTPLATVTGSTGPVPVGGAASSGGPAPATAPGSPSPGPGPACLLYAGEQGEIRVSGAAARTEAGNVAIDAQADAYAGERHLFGGQLHLDAAYLSPQVPGPRGAGWGTGAMVVGGRDGWSVGPAIAAPPLRLWRWQLEPSAAFTLGSAGQWAAAGTVILRRSP